MTGTWPTGWATGDIVTAAEFKKGAGCISDTTLGGSAANIDISSILGSYAHLLVSFYGRGDFAATAEAIVMRFNGDSAANYDFQYVRGVAATAAAAESFAQSFLTCGDIPANTAAANLFSAVEIFIPNYANATNNKSFVSISGNKFGVTTGLISAYLFAGGWRSNAAINRITILPGSGGNFVTGTRMSIYAFGS